MLMGKLVGGAKSRGETLVEVLFAITVLSMVIVVSLVLMNQGTSTAVRSLQITSVRQEIDSQAEALRFLNSSYISAYQPGFLPNLTDGATSPAEEYYKIISAVKARGASSVTAFGGTKTECQTPPDGSFFINTKTGAYVAKGANSMLPANTFSQVIYSSGAPVSEGLWIEAVRSTPGGGSSYTDFHIRACWSAVGAANPMNLGTIVRLYEPV